MKNIQQVKVAHDIAQRFNGITNQQTDDDNKKKSQNDVLKSVLSMKEYQAYEEIIHPESGPFGTMEYWAWDGIEIANEFWKEQGLEGEKWKRYRLSID